MDKNNKNLELMKNLIESVNDDNEMLHIITNLINELSNLDPVWGDSISKILQKNITKKFKNKIKTFFRNIKSKNYLLILNILLESFDTVEDLNKDIQEKAFYVILKELTYILNQNTLSFHHNYSKSLKFLKQFRLVLLA